MGAVRFAVAVDVMPKVGISDPQGQAVERALPSLGFEGIGQVRVGKRIEVVVAADGPQEALALVTAACLRILTNPVMEDFTVTLLRPVSSGSRPE